MLLVKFTLQMTFSWVKCGLNDWKIGLPLTRKIRYLQIISHYVKSFDGGVNKLPIIFLLFPPFYYRAYPSSVLLFFRFSKFQNINEKWVYTVWYEFTILCQFCYCPKTMLPIFSNSSCKPTFYFKIKYRVFELKMISKDFQ